MVIRYNRQNLKTSASKFVKTLTAENEEFLKYLGFKILKENEKTKKGKEDNNHYNLDSLKV